MPTLKLHYDGWLALPAAFRQALGLSSGDRLEAELVDGALVLLCGNLGPEDRVEPHDPDHGLPRDQRSWQV